jgi:hypothetical protein
MSADIIPIRPMPDPSPDDRAHRAALARLCAAKKIDWFERAIVDALERGDLRSAVLHFAALFAANLGPHADAALEQSRIARCADLLDHIDQAARRLSRDEDNA